MLGTLVLIVYLKLVVVTSGFTRLTIFSDVFCPSDEFSCTDDSMVTTYNIASRNRNILGINSNPANLQILAPL